jgi:hypothetical protein
MGQGSVADMARAKRARRRYACMVEDLVVSGVCVRYVC